MTNGGKIGHPLAKNVKPDIDLMLFTKQQLKMDHRPKYEMQTYKTLRK